MKKRLISIFIVILIIGVIFISIKLTDNKNKNENYEEKNNTKISESQNSFSNAISLSLKDKSVTELYRMISTNTENEFNGKEIYKDNIVTYDSLSNVEKIIFIIQYIDKINSKVNTEELNNNENKKELYVEEINADDFKKIKNQNGQQFSNISDQVYMYKKDVINKFGKEMFGDKYIGIDNILKDGDNKYIAKNLNGWYGNNVLEFHNGQIYKYEIYDEDRRDNKEIVYDSSKTYLIKAEQKNDLICLYDVFIYQETYDTRDDNSKIYNYSSSSKREKINIDYTKINGDNDYIEQIRNAINKLHIYKHTFKKNEDGNFYWIRTEIDNTKNITLSKEKNIGQSQYEEYPDKDNILMYIDILNDLRDDSGIGYVDLDEVGQNLKKRTIYSILNNRYRISNGIENTLGEKGDSTSWVSYKSNYPQFNYTSDNLKKYNEKISYQTYIDVEEGIGWEKEKKTNNYYYKIDQMLIVNGNNMSKEDYLLNSRAKKIKVVINNEKEFIFELKDTNIAQIFDVDYVQKTIDKPVNIQVEVLESYNGEKNNDIYISDLKFGLISNIPSGR